MRAKGWMDDGNGRSVSGKTGRLLLNRQLLQAGFPLTVIPVEEQARYLGALDQGLPGRIPRGAKSGHAGQMLDLQTLVAVERSLDLAAGAAG